MKKVATGSLSNDHARRESVLMELGAAIASKPINLRRVRNAAEKVKEVGGMELLVEMSAVAG